MPTTRLHRDHVALHEGLGVARREYRLLVDVEAHAAAEPVAHGPGEGESAANPHAVPGATMLEAGQCVVLDFGAKSYGYCSDMTRTVFLGEPESQMRSAWEAVRAANEAVEAMLAPGVTGKEAHERAEAILAEGGFAGAMGHGLGHGVGLDIHEEPPVSTRGHDGGEGQALGSVAQHELVQLQLHLAFRHTRPHERAANEAVEAMLAPGVTGKEAHERAEAVLAEGGFAGAMGHGLGHGGPAPHGGSRRSRPWPRWRRRPGPRLRGGRPSPMVVRDTSNIRWLTAFDGVFDDEDAHALYVAPDRVVLHSNSISSARR